MGNPIIYFDDDINDKDDDGADDDDKDEGDVTIKFIRQILYQNRHILNRPLICHNFHSDYHRYLRLYIFLIHPFTIHP